MTELQKTLLQLSKIKLSRKQVFYCEDVMQGNSAEQTRYLRTFIGNASHSDALVKYRRSIKAHVTTEGTIGMIESLYEKTKQHKPWAKSPFVGIEIELCMPWANKPALDAFKCLGLTVKGDSSIQTNGQLTGLRSSQDTDITMELNLLMRQGNYSNLKRLLELLNANGAYVNRTCGIHVHLDQRHNDRKSAILEYSRLQTAVAPLLSKLVVGGRLYSGDRTNYAQLNKDNNNKRQAVNFLPYQKGRHTIEVRLHHGSLDFAELVNWIDLLIRISRTKGLARPKTQPSFNKVLKSLKLSPRRNEVIRALAAHRMQESPVEVQE